MSTRDGGLGTALVGEKIAVNATQLSVTKFLGEGGFAYVYLVKEIGEGDAKNGEEEKKSRLGRKKDKSDSSKNKESDAEQKLLVLKVTSILSRQQREIAEKEANLLSRLSHPSIIKMFDTCYRTVPASSTSGFRKSDKSNNKDMMQHLILMEYCEGGHSMGICSQLKERGEKFDLATLIIAFGQICNAVSYLHAQRPPIVHRDLKPENFLIKNGAYKLCDFGSACIGPVELKTPQARAEAEEVIQKTTTQMFRAPEMVDLYMAKKLTQATDVWALGCCLYSLAYLQNCFEEGSNLAILSRKYKIPDDNPYGDGLVELIDRMLTIDSKERADMTEVILCLSAVYSGRPLPPRKERKKKDKKEKEEGGHAKDKKVKDKKEKSRGTYRTDGQGVYGENLAIDPKKLAEQPKEVKKLDPNSAAARRRKAAAAGGDDNLDFAAFGDFDKPKHSEVDNNMAFSTADNPFASFGDSDGKHKKKEGEFDANIESAFDALAVGEDDKARRHSGRARTRREETARPQRARSRDVRRAPRRGRDTKTKEEEEENKEEEENREENGEEENKAGGVKLIKSRGVRRVASGGQGLQRARSRSRGAGLRRSSRKGDDHNSERDNSDNDSE